LNLKVSYVRIVYKNSKNLMTFTCTAVVVTFMPLTHFNSVALNVKTVN